MSETCKDCFNGCLERVPDNCVRYTGINIPLLEIENGNSLAYVQSQIFEYILSIITGEGVKISIPNEDLCEIISENLPSEGVISLQQIIIALAKAICATDTLYQDLHTAINLIERRYNTTFFPELAEGTNTHEVLQATINALQTLHTDFGTLLNTLEANYVTSVNVDDYIQNYNETLGGSLLMHSKMIPYAAVLYFPTASVLTGKFDSTGSGIGAFVKIYLCNGIHGTPNIPNPIGGYYIMYIP